MHSWFEASARFPSTTPAANMNSLAGLLYQSYLDRIDPSVCSNTILTTELLGADMIGKNVVDGKMLKHLEKCDL